MKREVTILYCDECEAELSRSDRDRIPTPSSHWTLRLASLDVEPLAPRTFCGEACARSYFDRVVSEYAEWHAEWHLLQVPNVASVA